MNRSRRTTCAYASIPKLRIRAAKELLQEYDEDNESSISDNTSEYDNADSESVTSHAGNACQLRNILLLQKVLLQLLKKV